MTGRKDDSAKARWDLFPWRGCAWLLGQRVGGGKVAEPFKGAPRPDLVPAIAMAEVERVLAYGAQRYGADNWREVPHARKRYFAAAMRHLIAWWLGEKADRDTGISHLAHVGCCVLFLLANETEREKAGN